MSSVDASPMAGRRPDEIRAKPRVTVIRVKASGRRGKYFRSEGRQFPIHLANIESRLLPSHGRPLQYPIGQNDFRAKTGRSAAHVLDLNAEPTNLFLFLEHPNAKRRAAEEVLQRTS